MTTDSADHFRSGGPVQHADLEMRCGCSQCELVLPHRGGRGGKLRYCPDRRWEPGQKTCRQMAAVERAALRALGRPAPETATPGPGAVASATSWSPTDRRDHKSQDLPRAEAHTELDQTPHRALLKPQPPGSLVEGTVVPRRSTPSGFTPQTWRELLWWFPNTLTWSRTCQVLVLMSVLLALVFGGLGLVAHTIVGTRLANEVNSQPRSP